VKWFGKEPRAAAISFELEAIANCAVHPKFLDEAVVSAAKVDDMYLNFSDHLHDFVDAVEEKFAADGAWTLHLYEVSGRSTWVGFQMISLLCGLRRFISSVWSTY
jgi:hypothetical protein